MGSQQFTATHPQADSVIDLSRDWKVKHDISNIGEAEGWFDSDIDDHDWKNIHAGRTLEQEGLEGVSGVVWYRKRVTIPESWKTRTVYFAVGGINNGYSFYLNGTRLAEFDGEVAQARIILPLKTLRFGGSNVFVFKVSCEDHHGGLVHLPFALAFDPVALGGLVYPLYHNWKFKQDPRDRGIREKWSAPEHPDDDWQVLQAGKSWEEQGFDKYDGIGWFRKSFDFPPFWGDEPVYALFAGVDDEYELFVNGERVAKFGDRHRDHSVYATTTITDISAYVRRQGRNTLALRVVDWGGGGGLTRLPVQLVSLKEQPAFSVPAGYSLDKVKSSLPAPILEENPGWVEMYWKAWEIGLQKIKKPTIFNGFVSEYMDEAFNDNIFQWDTCFMVLFGRYAWHAIPAVQSLDNFYAKQDADGFICREIRESDGTNYWDKHLSRDTINPPLFSWIEWESYLLSGDSSRFRWVLDHLVRYFNWIERHRRWGSEAGPRQGLYWSTGFACGMDNSPRTYEKGGKSVHEHYNYAWIDMTAQQGLNALYIARIAEAAGQHRIAAAFRQKYAELKELVNSKMWDPDLRFYNDLDPDGEFSRVKTLASYWPLLARMSDDRQNAAMVEHLKNPQEFWRPHLFPTLSADHPLYHPKGDYWKGGVWAPTNYMVIKALQYNGFEQLATEATANHLQALYVVYQETGTFWENYAPEVLERGNVSRGDFVGWTGCGPIALFIENILGFRANAPQHTLTWRISRMDRHGIENLRFGPVTATLICDARSGPDDPLTIRVQSTANFTLIVHTENKTWTKQISKGSHELTLE